MNSGDGISATDAVTLPTNSHADLHWTFSEAGTYEITFQASGEVSGAPVAESATYTFVVVPEPGSAMLIGLGLAGFALRRRRGAALA
jgi:surface-anchored protein